MKGAAVYHPHLSFFVLRLSLFNDRLLWEKTLLAERKVRQATISIKAIFP